jgi:hypothetical protein
LDSDLLSFLPFNNLDTSRVLCMASLLATTLLYILWMVIAAS